MRKTYWLALLLTLGSADFSVAQDDKPDEACIDKAGNNNKKIDTPHEIRTFALHLDKTFREQDKDCDGVVTKVEMEEWQAKKMRSVRFRLAVRDLERRVSAGTGPTVEKKKDETPKVGETPAWTQAPGSGQFYLRRDFQDFHTWSNPKAKASGAAGNGADFAVSWDQEASNRAISAKGVAFMPFILNHTFDETQLSTPYVAAVAIAPSVRFEYLSNSNPQLKKKNVEIVTPGITTEVEVGRFLNLSHFLRARGSIVTSMGHTDSWQLRGEWQPIEPSGRICVGTPCTLFGSPILFRFDPIFVTEYAGAMPGSDLASQPLFMDRDRALRLGPSLALKMFPNALRSDELPIWLQHAEFKAGYSWYSDVFNGRRYSLLDLALTLRANKDDTLGLSFSYSRGNAEDTAQQVDVGKVGIAVKF